MLATSSTTEPMAFNQAAHRYARSSAPAERTAQNPIQNPLQTKAPLSGAPAPALTLHENQQLFLEGDRAERYYQVLHGLIRTVRLLADGRRQVMDFFGPGEVFALSGDTHYAYDAEAVTDSAVAGHSLQRLGSRVDSDPALARKVLGALSRELAHSHDRILLLGRKTARERIASFLLAMAERQGRHDWVDLPMKRADIADHLGLTVETVSRVLACLKRSGQILLRDANRIELCDPEGLREIAAGTGAP
jgi:CRP-like cAMP-binding protein